MGRPRLAPDGLEGNLILVGDQAFTPEEYKAREALREWDREYRKRRYHADPEHRERVKARVRAWKRSRQQRKTVTYREYASLHDLRCTGPTRPTGCRCRKIRLLSKVEAAA